MENNSPKRYRISVPLDDASVISWINCQHSFSLSIRQLIKAAIEVNGMRDYFASDAGEVVQRPRRGRPPKQKTVVVQEDVTKDDAFVDESLQELNGEPNVVLTSEPVSKSTSALQDRIALMQGILNR